MIWDGECELRIRNVKWWMMFYQPESMLLRPPPSSSIFFFNCRRTRALVWRSGAEGAWENKKEDDPTLCTPPSGREKMEEGKESEERNIHVSAEEGRRGEGRGGTDGGKGGGGRGDGGGKRGGGGRGRGEEGDEGISIRRDLNGAGGEGRGEGGEGGGGGDHFQKKGPRTRDKRAPKIGRSLEDEPRPGLDAGWRGAERGERQRARKDKEKGKRTRLDRGRCRNLFFARILGSGGENCPEWFNETTAWSQTSSSRLVDLNQSERNAMRSTRRKALRKGPPRVLVMHRLLSTISRSVES